jgi:hypothetical protein
LFLSYSLVPPLLMVLPTNDNYRTLHLKGATIVHSFRVVIVIL